MPPFKAGDVVVYRSGEPDRDIMEVLWCGLGKEAKKQAKFKHVSPIFKEEYIVVYADDSGYDDAKSVRLWTKLEQVLK